MSKYLIKQINNIRIMPMAKDEEETIEHVQKEYFEDRLPNKEHGWFDYYNSGLDAIENDLILFQYDNSIIASALFSHVIPYQKENYKFKGTIVLKKDSIKTFKPISVDDLKQFLDIKRLSQTKFGFKKEDVKSLDILIDKLEIPR